MKGDCGECNRRWFCDIDPKECDEWPDPVPISNGKHIRAMSDYELAKWLLDVMKHHVACFGEGAFGYAPFRNTEHDCIKCGVAWLQQPAECE